MKTPKLPRHRVFKVKCPHCFMWYKSKNVDDEEHICKYCGKEY